MILTGTFAGTVAGVAVGGLFAAVTEPASTDYAGIAMIIAACGSVVGTIGGLVIALRRKSTASEAADLLKALKDMEQGGPDAP